jgi:hypothetical protein
MVVNVMPRFSAGCFNKMLSHLSDGGAGQYVSHFIECVALGYLSFEILVVGKGEQYSHRAGPSEMIVCFQGIMDEQLVFLILLLIAVAHFLLVVCLPCADV